MNKIQLNALTAFGLFIFGSSMAFASMSAPTMTPQTQQYSPSMQNRSSHNPPPIASGVQPQSEVLSGSAPMVPTKPSAGPVVSNGEIMHFASALREIAPLSSKMRGEAMQKGVSKSKQQALEHSYARDVQSILAKNDLSTNTYEMLMTKAHDDPQFAKKVETAIKSGA
ncbi:hypothetical protein B1757_07715 [Acidithiobacillus marinus]|uniref:DUF4168 domain-containing protein n=1 Tax=Acidithiobacillus marinus TaxID=187490 RepID=A0A2I1DLU0_9PROT|nr:DUF4168 domain-containing protein [Acidithiobacillus marinus]PKY10834.1 hypothetical protein B1757_07715 [Acidithiobacillus marinus]